MYLHVGYMYTNCIVYMYRYNICAYMCGLNVLSLALYSKICICIMHTQYTVHTMYIIYTYKQDYQSCMSIHLKNLGPSHDYVYMYTCCTSRHVYMLYK